jgi:hypothetical protein
MLPTHVVYAVIIIFYILYNCLQIFSSFNSCPFGDCTAVPFFALKMMLIFLLLRVFLINLCSHFIMNGHDVLHFKGYRRTDTSDLVHGCGLGDVVVFCHWVQCQDLAR